MQQQETRAAGSRSVTRVQSRDASRCDSQQRLVAVDVLGCGVQPVGEQCKMQVAFGTGEMVDLQTLDLLLDGVRRGQKRRYGDEGAQMRGNAVGQLQGRQKVGVEAEADRSIDQRDRGVNGGDRAQRRENPERPCGKAHGGESDKRDGEQDQGDGGDGAGVKTNARSPMQAHPPLVLPRVIADLVFKILAAAADKVITGIAFSRVRRGGRLIMKAFGRSDGAVRNVEFGGLRTARQFLDGGAVEIARREIHVLVGAVDCERRRRPG